MSNYHDLSILSALIFNILRFSHKSKIREVVYVREKIITRHCKTQFNATILNDQKASMVLRPTKDDDKDFFITYTTFKIAEMGTMF